MPWMSCHELDISRKTFNPSLPYGWEDQQVRGGWANTSYCMHPYQVVYYLLYCILEIPLFSLMLQIQCNITAISWEDWYHVLHGPLLPPSEPTMVLQSNDMIAVYGNYTAVVCVVGATFVVWSIEDGATYCRCGKIYWAKCSGFQPQWSFHGNTFTFPWPEVLIS